MFKKIVALTILIVLGFVAAWLLIFKDGDSSKSKNTSVQSHPTYSLDLKSGSSYSARKPVMLHFAIQNQNDNVLKDFDTVHEKKLHLIIVRKDRTNFQHVHPELDASSGDFMIESFTFPTDGDYRVYADFTPANAQKDEMGMKLAVTPYRDVKVGDLSKYNPQKLSKDKLTSNTASFSATVFRPEGDSPGSAEFSAGQPLNIVVSINKNGVAYTKLQTYLGALGHMVVLGPKLEFIHAHPQTTDIKNQDGLIIFNVNFPEPGRYKLYLQTQASGQVTTNDFTVSAKGSSTKSQSKAAEDMDMMNMDHSVH